MFEYGVRPFQSPAAHGRTVIASTPKGTRERATLTWGGKADVPPVAARNTDISVDCRATRGVQKALPGEPAMTSQMTAPYAQRDLADDDHPWRVSPVTRNSQSWQRIDPVAARTDGGAGYQFGTPLIYRRTETVVIDDKKTDECAGDWEQMSGVASGVRAAFAELDADIKAGGAGVTHKTCRTTLMWDHNKTGVLWGKPDPENPYPAG